jgi:hypothetical protein
VLSTEELLELAAAIARAGEGEEGRRVESLMLGAAAAARARARDAETLGASLRIGRVARLLQRLAGVSAEIALAAARDVVLGDPVRAALTVAEGEESGDRSKSPERPDGCCPQIGRVFSSANPAEDGMTRFVIKGAQSG